MSETFEGWTLKARYVRCGKPGCKSCPHGPYWYGYQHREGKMRTRYFGKTKPASEPDRSKSKREADAGSSKPGGPEKKDEPKPHRFDAMFSERTRDYGLAREIMKFDRWETITKQQLRDRYRHLCLKNHPDRGGNPRVMAWINAAYEHLQQICN